LRAACGLPVSWQQVTGTAAGALDHSPWFCALVGAAETKGTSCSERGAILDQGTATPCPVPDDQGVCRRATRRPRGAKGGRSRSRTCRMNWNRAPRWPGPARSATSTPRSASLKNTLPFPRWPPAGRAGTTCSCSLTLNCSNHVSTAGEAVLCECGRVRVWRGLMVRPIDLSIDRNIHLSICLSVCLSVYRAFTHLSQALTIREVPPAHSLRPFE